MIVTLHDTDSIFIGSEQNEIVTQQDTKTYSPGVNTMRVTLQDTLTSNTMGVKTQQ